MKVAIIRRNGLGDLLTGLPLLSYIKAHFPDWAITLFVEERNAPLCPFLSPLAEIVVLKSKGNKYLNVPFKALSFRKNKFDIAISAKSSPMRLMNFFLFCLGAKKRIAYVDHSWDGRLVNQGIFYYPDHNKEVHQALKVLRLIAPELKEVPKAFYPKMHVPQSLLEKYPYREGLMGPFLLISATTTQKNNRLDPEKYSAAVNKLYEQVHFSVLLVSEKKDEERAVMIQKGLAAPSTLILPKNFESFIAAVGHADFLFVGDGGVAHIGAALDKPLCAIYGRISPQDWGPLSEKCELLYHREDVNYLREETLVEGLRTTWKRLQTRSNEK